MGTIKNPPEDTELRRHAEKELEIAADRIEAFAEMSPETMAHVIHELQVHQIELKMQNEELRRIQDELEQARDRYLQLYDFAPSGYATLSEKGLILEANRACANMLGCESDRLPGKPFSRFITEDSQDSYHFLFRDLLEKRSPQTCALRLNHKGIKTIHAKLDCIVKQDSADRNPCILVAITDISERQIAQETLQKSHNGLSLGVEKHTTTLKRMNEQLTLDIENLRNAETSLRESEARYRSLVESTSNSIYLVDEDCNYLFMNLKHKERLGLGAAPVKGTAYGSYHSKMETDSFRAKVKTVFDSGRSLSYEYQSERGGNYFVRTLSPVMDGDSVQAVSVISKNITAQKQAEKEAHRNRLELARMERLAITGELTASLSHELSQPLTAILSNAQAALRLIQGNLPQIDEVRAILQDIIASDRRAAEYINHLRSFFKKGELNKTALPINELIDDVVGLIGSEAKSRNISIEKVLGLKLPCIEADYVHLQQVILNLILNALESMLEVNDRPRRVVISTRREDASCLKIGVRDFGKGINQNDLETIFKPYFTTKKDGMGMGLAICRSILEAHNGKIWAENNPDQGATFYFTLPIADEG